MPKEAIEMANSVPSPKVSKGRAKKMAIATKIKKVTKLIVKD